MSNNVKILRVVLASPNDVQAERNKLPEILEELNHGIAADRDLRLELYRWETDAHPGFHAQGPQGLIDPRLRIEDCDVVIGVFWKKFGTPVRDAGSGTEHEIRLAYEAWKRKRTPQIMVYFSQMPYAPASAEETEQWGRVLRFKENFPPEGLWWPYRDETDFERLVRNHLALWIREKPVRPAPPPPPPPPPGVYECNKPVKDPGMFFGRREEMAEILEGVRRGDSFACIGGYRMGKTSLLFQLKQALLADLPNRAGCVVGPVFLSAQQFSRLSQTAIYRQIVQDFKQEVWSARFPHERLGDDRLFDRGIAEEEAFDAFGQVLERIVQVASNDVRIVVLLDEVDLLQPHEWAKTFFHNLRHLISVGPLRDNIAMVIAGTLAINSLWRVSGSPFINVLAGIKTLGLLPPEDAGELVQRPTGRQVPPDVEKHIYGLTGGHPCLIQYLMKHLCGKFAGGLQSVSRAHVDEAVEKYMRERTDFSFWASKFTDVDKAVYRLIAGCDQAVKKMEVIQAVGDAEHANRALEVLAHIGVIREAARNSYVVAGQMFRTWFAEFSDEPKRSGAGSGSSS